ncbi:molybdopterin dehydrogenase FAD-binding [Solidesulfovibrio fructosivorans JJ]]|uniref:Molybdopterin dehydrogenase FAD-binding n=1 Tax=Solidesulfovibrio fructosivorans JJ] TaxID=596151 RepID=E1JTQ2_SOLFR|nr:xanthine dehydrogenase family protein subunit M [Solidesulfovibrio fructosivorans]EFL52181.1 molybdopterin dehydrogenase FAD-binding [Solidesulfovibrio fructosivorans JJ]]
MAIVRDGMPPFALYQPTGIEDALALADRLGPGAWLLAGGLDSLERFKDRIKRPKAVIDLGGIAALRGVSRTEGGDCVIGPMTTLTEVAGHPLLRERFGLLAAAAGEVASPQIRNQGTIGGNVSQDTRCWYYRGGFDCYRAGGNICYAAAPEGMNREHAIFGVSRCAAVSPSDTAPALVALEAKLTIQNASGSRTVAAGDYFIGPDEDITRLNALGPGDILTEIRLPRTWTGKAFYFEKVRDRPVWDFPLVNIAAVMDKRGEKIERARFVLGAAAATPWRLPRVEAAVAGKTAREAVVAAQALAADGAVPLTHNAYKVALVRNLVKRAILGKEAS